MELSDERVPAGGRPSAPTRWHTVLRTGASVALGLLGVLLLSATVLFGGLALSLSAYLTWPSSAAQPSPAPVGLEEQVGDEGQLGHGRSKVSTPRAPDGRAGAGLAQVPTAAREGSAGSRPRQEWNNYVAPPVSLRIPTLDLQRRLTAVEVVEGSLQAPQRWSDVGWWEDGPNPGAAGSAVFLGHVDSWTGPAVFYRLSTLRKGDEIHVRRLDKTTATFRVAHSRLVDKDHFPSKQVYRLGGRPTLRLITCGGAFDDRADHYTGNLVVTAYLVSEER